MEKTCVGCLCAAIDWSAWSFVGTIVWIILACRAARYTKNTYEVSRSQRQIENSFKFNESFDKFIDQSYEKRTQNYVVSGRITNPPPERSWRDVLHNFFSMWIEFGRINAYGVPVIEEVKFEAETETENKCLERVLQLLDMYSACVLDGTADFKVLFHHLGFYMSNIFAIMNSDPNSVKILSSGYSSFYKLMNDKKEEFGKIPSINYLTDYELGVE